MPEIAEVARIVHFLRKHLVGKTLSKVTASDDPNVYGKVGTSAAEFQKSLQGKKVVGAGQQGKYFWIVMSSPPHPLMHFGMAGWLKIRSEDTYYYRKKEGKKGKEEEWPPKYMKFLLETDSDPKVEAAFVDFRRFARIRLLHCPEDQIRKIQPLSANGPDPVVDKNVVTEEWLVDLCRGKKVPIKALLLDQANISGIGNWVGDEIMYDAKMHPEQYSNTLSDAQLKQLHKSIHHICSTAVDLLGDSEQFPETWLFKHRWGKGKKDAPKALPNGEKITFLTVGGRTSAVIPSVQKKTGPVAKETSDVESEKEEKPSKGVKRKNKKAADEDDEEDEPPAKKQTKKAKKEKDEEQQKPKSKVNGTAPKPSAKGTQKPKVKNEPSNEKATAKVKEKPDSKSKKSAAKEKPAVNGSRRRSARLSSG
ncbi:MAG: hypothetical protein Q9160_000891 [Pyrenula sp. 1 TL-2023]